MTASKTTTDHDTIRQWAEERGGNPARVDTGGEGGILRIDFDDPEDRLEKISWDDFFYIFEDNNLAFLYQERTEEGTSRFNKFIERD